MWWNRKFAVITVVVVLLVIALLLVGEGCTKAVDDNNSQTEIDDVDDDGSQSEADVEVDENLGRMPPQMNLGEVAEILGIEREEVENAFNQARDEMFDGDSFPQRGEWLPDSPPTDRVSPEGLSEDVRPPAGGQLPESLLARMAEILNIDQQELADAFAQVQGNNSTQ